MNLEFFRIEEKGPAVVLTIDRPKALNALNSKVLSEFLTALEHVEEIQTCRALILTGAGEKSFIAGADIAEMSDLPSEKAYEFARKGQIVTQKLASLPFPVIAAVNGFALGGGCEMAIACDFIICSKNAVFGQPEVSLGIITGFGGAVRLAQFVGTPRARELIFSGRRINSDEALRIGLVNEVVEREKLLERALEIANSIALNSPLAVRNVRKVMQEIESTQNLDQCLEKEARAFANGFGSFDQKEGTRAFVEKRKPTYRGK